jgi:hypothetical protein
VLQLGDREHVHQVEEQFDVGDPLHAGTIPEERRNPRLLFGQSAHR